MSIVGPFSQGSVKAPQKFSYSGGQTPYLRWVFPAVSYGGSGTKINLWGTHRIKDLGQDKAMGSIYGIMIGDNICSRFGIFQDPIV